MSQGPKKKESFSEPTQINSGRNVPPTMRTEAPRPLPPPKNDRSRTISPDQKDTSKKNEKEEMTILKQYIDFLSQERVLLKDERAAMM